MLPDDETVSEMRARVQKHIEILRALAEEYLPSAEAPRITTVQKRLVRSTPLEGLRAAANFVENVPGVGGMLADRERLLRAIDFRFEHEYLLMHAKTLVNAIEDATVRGGLEAVQYARGLYRVGKSYVITPQTERLEPFIDGMKRTLGRKKYRKSSEPEEENEPEL